MGTADALLHMYAVPVISTLVTDHTVPSSMRAAVLYGPRDLRVVDRPVPRPGPEDVLVRVEMCGACGTDLKILDGHFP